MNYPLFLTYQSPIIGNGFVAEITARAQLLATQEEDGWWLYGVHPGGIAESGDTLDQAHLEMRESLRLVFADFATEADTFDAFKSRVEKFFEVTDETTVAEWKDALAAIRKQGDGSLNLPRIQGEKGFFVEVVDRTQKLHGGNVTNQELAAAA